MKQFQVPQFIDVEDKLFGPLTLKQFIYLAGGGGTVYVLIQVLPTIAAVIIGLPVAVLALSLSFWKPNGQSFIIIMQAAIIHLLSPKLYLWQKDPNRTDTPASPEKDTPKESNTEPTSNFRPSKLETLAWSLDVFDASKETDE